MGTNVKIEISKKDNKENKEKVKDNKIISDVEYTFDGGIFGLEYLD